MKILIFLLFVLSISSCASKFVMKKCNPVMTDSVFDYVEKKSNKTISEEEDSWVCEKYE